VFQPVVTSCGEHLANLGLVTRNVVALVDRLAQSKTGVETYTRAEQLAAGALYVDTGYLVVDEVGGRLHPDTVSDRWNQLVVAAGVRRIRLHDARHTCGTLMHLEGVPTAVIAAWLEHASPAFTMRTYVHSQHDALRHAADVLGSVTRA
jgi:integrase